MSEKIIAKKSDWKTSDMPEKNTVFTMKRIFSPEEKERLKYGIIPQEMEDKWFIYHENGKLYIHRSWTGYCIYILEPTENPDIVRVTVNRDQKQYTCTDIDHDISTVCFLLKCMLRH